MRPTVDLRRAMAAYVRGHDRVWEDARMMGPEDPAAGVPRIEWGRVPHPARFGVGVARELDFRRGPVRWRDSAPPGRAEAGSDD